MDLLCSVFITDKRWSHTVYPRRETHNNLDIFKCTLQSYSHIDFDKVYLFVKLDENYLFRKNELIEYCNDLFGNKLIFENNRPEKQEDWIPILSHLSEDKLIFFTQNHDHVYIDFNLDILKEGIEFLKNDTSKYKALPFTHWPEIIRLAGLNLYDETKMIGSYLNFTYSLNLPACIWNFEVLKFICIENKWPDNLWKSGMFDGLPFNFPFMSTYVPLRELCRQFEGYSHILMRTDVDAEFPELEIPLKPFLFTEAHLKWRFRPNIPGECDHKGAVSYVLKEWEDKMIELYEPIIIRD